MNTVNIQSTTSFISDAIFSDGLTSTTFTGAI